MEIIDLVQMRNSMMLPKVPPTVGAELDLELRYYLPNPALSPALLWVVMSQDITSFILLK